MEPFRAFIQRASGVSKKGHPQQPRNGPYIGSLPRCAPFDGPRRQFDDRGESPRHYAKALARGMGITFYVVRSRKGGFLAVQIPSDDCEIRATVAPPRSTRDTLHLGPEQRAA